MGFNSEFKGLSECSSFNALQNSTRYKIVRFQLCRYAVIFFICF